MLKKLQTEKEPRLQLQPRTMPWWRFSVFRNQINSLWKNHSLNFYTEIHTPPLQILHWDWSFNHFYTSVCPSVRHLNTFNLKTSTFHLTKSSTSRVRGTLWKQLVDWGKYRQFRCETLKLLKYFPHFSWLRFFFCTSRLNRTHSEQPFRFVKWTEGRPEERC